MTTEASIKSKAKSYVVIAGPTGSGKSALGLALSEALDGEIINCDSVQVYRGFMIGAAKATAAERSRVPHHLLDVVQAHENYDAALFAATAHQCKTEIWDRGRLPVIVGGTGLYLRAFLGQGWHSDLPQDARLRDELRALPNTKLLEDLRAIDPVRAAGLHPNDRVRLLRSLELVRLLGRPLADAGLTAEQPADPAALVIVIEPLRPVLHARIERRTRAMLAQGLIDEVKDLLASGISPAAKPMQSIGYKQVCAYLQGQLREDQLEDAIVAATRQYAKRQCTWFRRLTADLRLSGDEPFDAVLASLREGLR